MGAGRKDSCSFEAMEQRVERTVWSGQQDAGQGEVEESVGSRPRLACVHQRGRLLSPEGQTAPT